MLIRATWTYIFRSGEWKTFMFNGPCFANMDILITTNPLDVHEVLRKNFSNYPKGEKFHKIFDIMGEGIFNSDNELWEIHRKVTMLLEFNSGQGNEMDLQDIFQRFSFDTICKLLLDHDPKSLSLDYPYVPCFKAFSDAEEAILYRHVTPPSLWKLQQLFRVGNEKKMNDAWRTIDQFIYKCLN
ncbi:cytochrome P450, partial [Tanacetum coccineum]